MEFFFLSYNKHPSYHNYSHPMGSRLTHETGKGVLHAWVNGEGLPFVVSYFLFPSSSSTSGLIRPPEFCLQGPLPFENRTPFKESLSFSFSLLSLGMEDSSRKQISAGSIGPSLCCRDENNVLQLRFQFHRLDNVFLCSTNLTLLGMISLSDSSHRYPEPQKRITNTSLSIFGCRIEPASATMPYESSVSQIELGKSIEHVCSEYGLN